MFDRPSGRGDDCGAFTPGSPFTRHGELRVHPGLFAIGPSGARLLRSGWCGSGRKHRWRTDAKRVRPGRGPGFSKNGRKFVRLEPQAAFAW